jgi:hypothetical protein
MNMDSQQDKNQEMEKARSKLVALVYELLNTSVSPREIIAILETETGVLKLGLEAVPSQHIDNQVHELKGDLRITVDERSFFVPLTYKKPSNMIGWPLYYFRQTFSSATIINISDIEKIKCYEVNEMWRVELAKNCEISGLDNIESFKNLMMVLDDDMPAPSALDIG